MKFNWNPSKVAFVDFETQSAADLITHKKYASDPSTRALCLSVRVDGVSKCFGPYLDGSAKQEILSMVEGRTLVAHNAPFDAAVWELAEKMPELEWFDTLPCARAAGLPGKLDDLGTVLTGEGKDKNGKLLIAMLCHIKNGKVPAVGPAHKLLMQYCNRDTELLEQIYNHVKSFGEPDVMTEDYTVNRRGIPLDANYASKLIEAYAHNTADRSAEYSEMTGGINPSSHKQVKEWLTSQGFPGVESIGKFAFKAFLDHADDYFVGDGELDAAVSAVQEMMQLRRELVRVGRSKIESAVAATDDDGRLRDQFVYYGAHSGRWSGRDLQPHNMPHAVKEVDSKLLAPEYTAIVLAAAEASERAKRRIGPADVLNAMARHMVRADNLLIADYSAVEARCLAWVAEELLMLQLFSDPHQSVYLDMGEQVFGRRLSKSDDPREYILAKTLVLGCGYGMSGAKFQASCTMRSVKLDALKERGLTAQDAVKAYRSRYARIPAVWKEYNDAAKLAVSGSEAYAGKCLFKMVGPDLHMVLPSGRPMVYRNARIEMLVPGYCKLYGMPETPVPTIVFDKPRKGRGAGFLYGSKICENACQAICRDLLADAMLKAEQEGFHPCLHVHDELVCEDGPERFERFMEIMSDPPAWAKGFPLMAEGYSGPIWTKNPKGYTEGASLSGRML